VESLLPGGEKLLLLVVFSFPGFGFDAYLPADHAGSPALFVITVRSRKLIEPSPTALPGPPGMTGDNFRLTGVFPIFRLLPGAQARGFFEDAEQRLRAEYAVAARLTGGRGVSAEIKSSPISILGERVK
jgi:hypothetical protein